MNRTFVVAVAGSALAVVLGASTGSASDQQPAPTENKGVVGKPLGAVDLGPEIEGMAGRQLRIRSVTIEPGGVIASHNHKDRPCVEYILEGRVIEYRNGVARELVQGDFVMATKETTHWWANKGDAPVVLLPVDVFKP